jgi:Ca2+/Na+ antiporter
MKKISWWAKNHKVYARLIIVVSFIFLNALAFITGHFLHQLGIIFLPGFLYACFFVFLITLIAYPRKIQQQIKRKSSGHYRLQKSCDFILAASTFCMVVCLSNQPQTLIQFYPKISAVAITFPVKDSTVKHYKPISEFNSSLKDGKGNQLKWKERKKLLREQVREIKKDHNLPKGEKIALIILSALVAGGLIMLVAGLSCNLSCNGYGAAAAIVGIGGTALIVFLLVLAIRAINGEKRKRKLTTENTGKDK